MYAIVSVGGKQYKVAAGDTIEVEKIEGEAGTTVELPVIFLSNDGDIVVDAEELAKATVEAVIVEQFKGKKQIVFKFKKRKGYKKTQGHRQQLTRLSIASIADPAGNVVKAEPKAAKKAEEVVEEAEDVVEEVVETVEEVVEAVETEAEEVVEEAVEAVEKTEDAE